MDTKIINEFGQEILCYKLKTARQKKRALKKSKEKQLIQVDRKQTALYKIQRNIPYIDLEVPYQKGWKRFFILREDVARSNKAVFYQNILEKINTTIVSNRKDFKKKKNVKGKRIDIVTAQFTKPLTQVEFIKLRFTDKETAYFSWELVKEKHTNRYVKMLVFNEPWRYTLKTIPNIITQAKMIDEQLESEISEINNFIEKQYLQHKINKARSITTNYRWKKLEKPKYTFKKKNVLEWLNEMEQDGLY
jgi:hypothetical protein